MFTVCDCPNVERVIIFDQMSLLVTGLKLLWLPKLGPFDFGLKTELLQLLKSQARTTWSQCWCQHSAHISVSGIHAVPTN